MRPQVCRPTLRFRLEFSQPEEERPGIREACRQPTRQGNRAKMWDNSTAVLSVEDLQQQLQHVSGCEALVLCHGDAAGSAFGPTNQAS